MISPLTRSLPGTMSTDWWSSVLTDVFDFSNADVIFSPLLGSTFAGAHVDVVLNT